MLTNCVNCVAPIDPKLDKCPYCGTSYEAMGIESREDKSSELRIEMGQLASQMAQELNNYRVIYGLDTPNDIRRRYGLRGI